MEDTVDKQFDKYSKEYLKKVISKAKRVFNTEASNRQDQARLIIQKFDRILTKEMFDTTIGYTKFTNKELSMTLQSTPMDSRGRRYASYQDEISYQKIPAIEFITKPFNEALDTIPDRILEEIEGIKI